MQAAVTRSGRRTTRRRRHRAGDLEESAGVESGAPAGMPRFATGPQAKLDGGGHSGGEIGPSPKPSMSEGQPLSGDTRGEMESRLGTGLGDVRVHADSSADQVANTHGARALTWGRDIVFGRGEYAPDTVPGRRLLAHELTHVGQQRQAGQPRVQRKAKKSDFRIEGKHPDAGDYSTIAFFGNGSSHLDSTEKSKVKTLSKPTTRKLDLVGYASEEGADNASLAKKRVDKVASVLKAKGHDPTLVTTAHKPDAGKGQVDYRRWRSVEIIPEVGGKPGATVTSPCDTKPNVVKPCPTDELARIHTGLGRAAGLVANAIAKAATLSADPVAKALYDRLFTGVAPADAIQGFSRILVQLFHYFDPANLDCGTECFSDCDDTQAQNTNTGSTARMLVCPAYHNKKDADYRAMTLLHEASHGAPGLATDDHSYEWDRLFDQLEPAESKANADTYAMFAYLLENPGKRNIGPGTPDKLTGTKDATEQKAVRRAIARTEQWIQMCGTDTNYLYGAIKQARNNGGVWVKGWHETLMQMAHDHFGLTDPANPPTAQDQWAAAAVYDRFKRMGEVFSEQLGLKRTGSGRVSWQSNLGTRVDFGNKFFKGAILKQIEWTVAALIRATPGVSSGLRGGYLGFTKEDRTWNSLGP